MQTSRVNTLEKYSFKVSALSLEPYGPERDGIDGLVFNLDFAHFQNIFGFLFTIRATFNFRLDYIVTPRCQTQYG